MVEEVRLTYEQWQPRHPDLAVAQRETQHLELRGAYAPSVLSIRWAMEAWQDLAVPVRIIVFQQVASYTPSSVN